MAAIRPLADAVEYAIIATDPGGVVTLVSAEAERLFDCKSEAVVGRSTVDMLLCADELAATAAQLGLPPGPQVLFAPVRTDCCDIRPWTFVCKDGRRVPVSLTTMVMRGQAGAVLGYLLVARRISRRPEVAESMRRARKFERHAAQVRELGRAGNELASTVSHELRTPLTTVLGVLEMLIDGEAGPLEAAQARLLTKAERNSRRLLALIEDLLLVSGIEAGSVKINAQRISVQPVVDDALQALQLARAGNGPDLQISLPAEPLPVYGDREQLQRVIIHLVDNALKFTSAGGCASISAKQAGAYVELTVSDNGIGIPCPDLPHVFDPFFRASSAQALEIRGCGLGLTISRWIVERHGGNISIDSTLNGGTVVTCLLPQPSHQP